MRALYIDAPGETRLGTSGQPAPARGEVLLRVRLAGFCGSDLSTFRGKNPLVSYPRIPGHEIAATIESAGGGVPEELTPGLAVAVCPYTACGTCASCRRGRANACQFNQTLGVQRDGAMTEFIAVPWEKVHVSEGLSLRELCLVEPLSVGFHAAARGRIASGDKVAVLGCGAIGLGAVAGSAFRGGETIAVDVEGAKLDLARKAGARHSINSQTEDLHERLLELTGGHGPDVVVEAIGLPETFRAAVEEAAFTGRVVYIGYAKQAVSYQTKLFVQKELDILGSRNAEPDDFQAVATMLRQRSFPVEEMITAVSPLEEAGEALRAWSGDPAAFTKILVDISGDNQPCSSSN